MGFDIRWSTEANFTFVHIITFINSGWGTSVAAKFGSKVRQTISVIETFPLSFPEVADMPNVRKAVISPQTSLYYEVFPDHVLLVFFWDNRQAPLFM